MHFMKFFPARFRLFYSVLNGVKFLSINSVTEEEQIGHVEFRSKHDGHLGKYYVFLPNLTHQK